MMQKNVDDYIQEGIYGAKETKPDERRRYLGTLRERIILFLTKGQVMQKKGREELAELMKEHPDAKLLLNGAIRYKFRKPYTRLADDNGIHATAILDQEKETDAGALLIVDYAIEKESIELDTEEPSSHESTEKEKGVKGFLKRLFRPL